MNKVTTEYMTIPEWRDYFKQRNDFLMRKLDEVSNVFDIEGTVYALRALAENIHSNMHRINSEKPK